MSATCVEIVERAKLEGRDTWKTFSSSVEDIRLLLWSSLSENPVSIEGLNTASLVIETCLSSTLITQCRQAWLKPWPRSSQYVEAYASTYDDMRKCESVNSQCLMLKTDFKFPVLPRHRNCFPPKVLYSLLFAHSVLVHAIKSKTSRCNAQD